MTFDKQPVVRVSASPGAPPPEDWSGDIPAVQQLLSDGLTLAPGVTFLVGENGSGKSTIVEAIAVAYGLSPEGGTAFGHHETRTTESDLHGSLLLQRGIGAKRWGFFLRAETMHGWYSFIEEHPDSRDPAFHAMSHGESFLAVLEARFDSPGFYVLDEPEAALSFASTLGLMARLDTLARSGAQVLCATHSPVLASLPGARILEVGPWGMREARWEDLELVRHWRAYLQTPDRYLRHLLDADA
ncbi:AAA family ATPase [Mumia sp. ZJ1417]|uniref:AAA family ATPase n=1 Tax=unclassified Mumia TaxID=2621872 RepID=UPI001424589D|nr:MULTISPECIES: AAA family ATPase [unclassified Mumia]QMW65296.1 AAA family ATPase [Mumia sp. ZJ1417]